MQEIKIVKYFDHLDNYLYGYMSAVKENLKNIKQNNLLLFPTTFLISNCLELWIKNMIYIHGHQYSEFTHNDWNLITHSIMKLLNSDEAKNNVLVKNVDVDKYKRICEIVPYYTSLITRGTLSEAMRFPISGKKYQYNINLDKINRVNYDEYISKSEELLGLMFSFYSQYNWERSVYVLALNKINYNKLGKTYDYSKYIDSLPALNITVADVENEYQRLVKLDELGEINLEELIKLQIKNN